MSIQSYLTLDRMICLFVVLEQKICSICSSHVLSCRFMAWTRQELGPKFTSSHPRVAARPEASSQLSLRTSEKWTHFKAVASKARLEYCTDIHTGNQALLSFWLTRVGQSVFLKLHKYTFGDLNFRSVFS
jgi:hypothetical protein